MEGAADGPSTEIRIFNTCCSYYQASSHLPHHSDGVSRSETLVNRQSRPTAIRPSAIASSRTTGGIARVGAPSSLERPGGIRSFLIQKQATHSTLSYSSLKPLDVLIQQLHVFHG